MKKLARKLVLSAMAMGLAVVTLSTTTYAWYVSNTEATVDGLQGFTATVNDPNLLVAKDKENKPEGGFSSAIELTTEDIALRPVTLDEDEKTFKNQDQEKVWVIGEDNAGKNQPYVEYKFWLFTTNATTIYFTGELNNTTSDFSKIKQTAYTDGEGILPDQTTGGEVTAPSKVGDMFAVDAVNALNCTITRIESTGSSLEDVELDSEEINVGEGCIKGFDEDYTSPEGLVHGGDANKYFKKLLGYNPFGTSEDGTSKELSNIDLSGGISITDGTPTQITIRIWLEGTSAGCWNSCVNQQFTLSLTLTTTDPKAKV